MLNLASGDPGLVYTLQQYTYRTLDRIENGNNARTGTSGMSVPGATSDQAHSETSLRAHLHVSLKLPAIQVSSHLHPNSRFPAAAHGINLMKSHN